MSENNPFKSIESTATVPANVKQEIVAELDTIRNASTLVELFVGNLINTASSAIVGASSQSETDNNFTI
jgi:hypothetical protein